MVVQGGLPAWVKREGKETNGRYTGVDDESEIPR